MTKSHHALRLLAEQKITNAGLCLTDLAALEALLHKGPLTITQIQEKVLLASCSMTAAIDRLEKRGLVVRKSTLSDRRAPIVELTQEGTRLIILGAAATRPRPFAFRVPRRSSGPRTQSGSSWNL